MASSIGDQVHVQHGDYEPLSPDRRVVATTIHGAKGLEFRAGHLMSADLVKKFRLQKKWPTPPSLAARRHFRSTIKMTCPVILRMVYRRAQAQRRNQILMIYLVEVQHESSFAW